MKAIVMSGYGSNDVLALKEVEKPRPGPQDLLIAVAAGSINPVDFKIRAGQMRLARSFPLPIIFGNDLAGTVAAVGPEAKGFKVGDEVYARVDKNMLGAFAEFAAVRADFCALRPRSISMAEAAGVPLVALTAWQAIFEELKIQKGERVFVPAGAGAVGSYAVQFAKQAGAFVATSASGAGIEFARSLGADQVIDYKSADPYTVLRDLDAVFDVLGGESLKRSFGLVRRGGRVVSIASVPDHIALRDMGANGLRQLFFRLVSAPLRAAAKRHGATYRYIFMRPDGALLARIAGQIDRKELKTRTDRIFPLAKFKEAIEHVESGKAKGKVIVSFEAHG